MSHQWKDTGRVWRNPHSDVLMLPPSHEGKSTQNCGNLYDAFAQGRHLETPYPGFLLDVGHVGTVSLACSRSFSVTEGKQAFGINHIVYII